MSVGWSRADGVSQAQLVARIDPAGHHHPGFAEFRRVHGAARYAVMSLVTASIAAVFIGEDEKALRREMHRDIYALREEVARLWAPLEKQGTFQRPRPRLVTPGRCKDANGSSKSGIPRESRVGSAVDQHRDFAVGQDFLRHASQEQSLQALLP
jgi:hypothetical protein